MGAPTTGSPGRAMGLYHDFVEGTMAGAGEQDREQAWRKTESTWDLGARLALLKENLLSQ